MPSISVEQWIVYVSIALLAGVLGQMLSGRSVGGFVASAVLGLLGAFLGDYIARSSGAQQPLSVTIRDHTIPVLWALVGATGAAIVVAFFRHRRSRSRA